MWRFNLLLLAMAMLLVAASASDRLVEKPITLQLASRATSGLGGEVPVVDPPKRTTGYFKLNRTHDAHMFFYMFESRQAKEDDPVVLWMTGGPGCSSSLAVFYENGPYSINDDLTLSETEYGWDVAHTVVFVDQPVGVGYSYTEDSRDAVYDEVAVGEDMLDFLTELMEAHPELASRPLFVTGESYAGHYGPAVTHRVWRANKEAEAEGKGPVIKLGGMAIGNGLTSPGLQFTSYADFAVRTGILDPIWSQLIDFVGTPICRISAMICNDVGLAPVCMVGNTLCQLTGMAPVLGMLPGINVYDVRRYDQYDFSLVEQFLNKVETKKALGVDSAREWTDCDPWIYSQMSGDILKDYVSLVVDLLEDGVPVMIYAGEKDLICNWLGNQWWLNAMAWSGQADFGAAKEFTWAVGGERAGTVRSAGPLSFVKVADAGHMVPMDQPANALAMITAFTRGKDLRKEADALPRGLAAPDAQRELIRRLASGHAAVLQQEAEAQDERRGGRVEGGGGGAVRGAAQEGSRYRIRSGLPRDLAE